VTELTQPAAGRWQDLVDYSEAYTCYSSALAAWVALERSDWRRVVNAGLRLTLVDAGNGLFGFSHFSPRLRNELGLVRSASDDAGEAVAAILGELEQSGRVIVAGDGFRLPWHVAAERRHVPHWFVLAGSPAAPLVVDPFACRNELGLQEASLTRIEPQALATLALAHPARDPVVALREAFALGDDTRPAEHGRFQWLARSPAETRAPAGPAGPDAVRRLARHFREHGRRPDAYRQADDIWSVARHRAFLARYATLVAADSDERLRSWVGDHASPLARRWSHMAPLLMQATLALSAGREPSSSVGDTLEELAGLEDAAAEAFPADEYHGWASPEDL
jgi:hypothetical protein